VLRISTANRPYFTNRSADTTHSAEDRAVRDHSAWLAVELAEPRGTDLAAAYPQMARLLAELSPDAALAVYAAATNEFFLCHIGWRETFAGQLSFQIPKLPGSAPVPAGKEEPHDAL
jgi:hypothetical protein